MKIRRFFLVGLAAFCGMVPMSSMAQTQNTGSVNQAFQTARSAVNPEVQTKVVSVYGIGTPGAIQKWYIIFYDPSVASHGRAVIVENNQISKNYPANGGTTYEANLTFDPSRITSEEPVLSAAQNYAAQHNITYDSVRVLLKETSVDKPFRWRVELLNSGKSRGFVYVNALDGSFASYKTEVSSTGRRHHSSDGGMTGFGQNVKSTFLGVGGDLEEIFTGDRTVDR